jgi:acyl carrier protein
MTAANAHPDRDLIGAVCMAVGRLLGRDSADIRSDSLLIDDLGLDSVGVLELLIEIEAVVAVEFDLDTLEHSHLATPQSLAAYLRTLMDGHSCS